MREQPVWPFSDRPLTTGAQILASLGLRKLRLLTNNPRKIDGLQRLGLEIVERLPPEIAPTAHNHQHLHAKKEKLGHFLEKKGVVE